MNAQQLKNSILQEAIEGRLVKQDPNDEPASALLDKIRAEKKRLFKEGKLKKKDLEETPVSEDEIPFEIPESWEWCRLGVLLQIFTGKKDANFGDENGEYDFFTCSNTPLKSNSYSYDGEFLIMPGNGANIGQVVYYNGKFEAYQRTYLLQAYSTLNLDYLKYHLLCNWKEYNQDKMYGSAIPYIKLGNLTSYMVALPPLAEQKRIVERIEELLPKVEEYGKAQEALDKLNEELPERLKKSILQEAITGRLVKQDPNDEPASALLDKIRAEKKRLFKEGKLKKKDLEETPVSEDEIPFEIPESWEWVKLSFVTSLLDGEKREGDYVCLDAKYLRGKSTGNLLPKGKFVNKKDNIILVDGENSGEVFTVPCDGYMGSTFKQLWVSKSMYLPYVLYFIRYYKDILRNSKKGAAIPHLNKEIFNNLIVGIPPLAEQKRIVEKIEQLLSKIDKLKS